MSHLTPPQVLLTGLKRTSEQAAHTVKEMNAEVNITNITDDVGVVTIILYSDIKRDER